MISKDGTILRNKTGIILNENLEQIDTLKVDIQPYTSTFSYDTNYIITLTHKIFCSVNDNINLLSYIKVDDDVYKVITINKWDEHLTLSCYKCEVITV